MRLYLDTSSSPALTEHVCNLACRYDHLDLCWAKDLPAAAGRRLNATGMNPTMWRFLPTVDPQARTSFQRQGWKTLFP